MAAALNTTRLLEVATPEAERITTPRALPLFLGYLHAAVGPSEVGKSTLAAHAVLDVASAGCGVLVLDGEMSAGAWRRKLLQLGADDAALGRIHYAEMANTAADVERVRATAATLSLRLIVWDSALSLISRTAKSENDNAEVGRVFDRLRAIVRDGPAGLIVDHSANGSATLVSRGASAKFAALDVSYGVRLAEGSIPGPLDQWESVVSVEKDRHGLLGQRADRQATFIPLGHGMLALDLVEVSSSTHRLSATNPVTAAVERIAELDPPPKSANDAFRRLGGRKQTVLTAYRQWSTEGGSPGSILTDGNRGTTPPLGSGNRFPDGNQRNHLRVAGDDA